MADIFVSYTSSDKDWAEWIDARLREHGHDSHLHQFEITGGEDIVAWMVKRHDAANHVLCVVSEAYLKAPYSTWERNAAVWQAVNKRPGFLLLVAVAPCAMPTLLDHFRRCELYGVPEDVAAQKLYEYLEKQERQPDPIFPGAAFAQSNISIRAPEHFLGRDDAMAALEAALARAEGRVAITALHGLRGVGKTVLAVAYAEKHRKDYRATWWLRAETEATLRADLVGLGVRLGWVEANAKEEAAVEAMLERLRHEGGGILLIYDNAIDADSLRPFLPKGGAAKVIVTSNAPNWRAVAAPVEIRVWPKTVGADFLIARTGRTEERVEAEALSVALGGLPLAHEQAAAYCETLDVGFAEYLKRFEDEPVAHLGDKEFTPQEHNDRQTVAKSFALAIEQAGKSHPLAEPLILHAALLAPEPIPLFFLEALWPYLAERHGEECSDEAIQESGEAPGLLRSARNDGGESAQVQLEKAIAALRRFALVDLEAIADERDAAQKTKCLRLHRLVRFVAAARLQGDAQKAARSRLIRAMQAVYLEGGYDDPKVWPRARRLDALALALVEDGAPPAGAEEAAIYLLDRLGAYRQAALGAYRAVLPLFEQALALAERHYPAEDAKIAVQLSNLGVLLRELGGEENLEAAHAHLTRALTITEKALGLEHPNVATQLSNLAAVLKDLGGADNLAAARTHLTRALAMGETALGPKHPSVAIRLSKLATVLQDLGGADNLETARAHLIRALAIGEKALGPEHPNVADDLSNLALVLRDLGGAENLEGARAHLTRALAIEEKALALEHPKVTIRLNNLARVLAELGGAENLREARGNFTRAEKILRAALGDQHPCTQKLAVNLADFRAKHGDA